MTTKFIYKCRFAGSNTDIYSSDLEAIREMHNDGAIVTCRRFKGVN